MTIGMILAGGTGSRVGADRPKQFVEILGKPIVAYTIEIYQNHPEVDVIEVVCHKEWKNYLSEIVLKHNFTKVKWITDGGNSFQESVMNGTNFLKDKINQDDIVMIHYGASPFTTPEELSSGLEVCKKFGMSASAIPCYQLIGSLDSELTSKNWVDRDKQIQITCPQTFRYSYLLDIYKRADEKNFLHTIEPHTTSLMYALSDELHLSYGKQSNIKITTKDDLDFFYVFLNGKNKEESK